jgi:exodeoxyribonuclease VII large subunit
VARWRLADAVIIGRGGGGREDLWAFNDERVARAIAACPVPTVSAVGHEIDLTICDLVADLRAPTPSAAAEALVPLRDDLVAELRAFGAALSEAAIDLVAQRRDRLRAAAREVCRLATRRTERDRASVAAVSGRLHALSPLATLARGYAVAQALDGTALTSVTAFAPGAKFDLRLRDGSIRATTDSVHQTSDADVQRPKA